MNAIDILEREHQGAKKAMKEVSLSSGAKRQELFRHLKKALEAHDRLEEDIFYPAVTAHPKAAALSAGDKDAHHSVEGILAKLEKMPADDAQWVPVFSGMRSKLLAHIADEEGDLFVKIRKALSPAELDSLGAKMAAFINLEARKA